MLGSVARMPRPRLLPCIVWSLLVWPSLLEWWKLGPQTNFTASRICRLPGVSNLALSRRGMQHEVWAGRWRSSSRTPFCRCRTWGSAGVTTKPVCGSQRLKGKVGPQNSLGFPSSWRVPGRGDSLMARTNSVSSSSTLPMVPRGSLQGTGQSSGVGVREASSELQRPRLVQRLARVAVLVIAQQLPHLAARATPEPGCPSLSCIDPPVLSCPAVEVPACPVAPPVPLFETFVVMVGGRSLNVPHKTCVCQL